MLEATPSQLAASSEPPNLDDWQKSHPVVAVMHQSAVNNGTTNFLSGVTLKDDEVRQKIIDLNNGKLPEKLANDEDQEPWSIRFAKFRPISLDVRDGGVAVTVRGTRIHDRRRSDAARGDVYHGRLQDRADRRRPAPDPRGRSGNRCRRISIQRRRDCRSARSACAKCCSGSSAKCFRRRVKPEPIELGGQWKGRAIWSSIRFKPRTAGCRLAYRWVPKADAKAVASKE